MSALNSNDTSNELHIYRFGSGIKLIRPNQAKNPKSTFLMHDTKHTVNSIFELPLSVYFIRADGINANVNEHDVMC